MIKRRLWLQGRAVLCAAWPAALLILASGCQEEKSPGKKGPEDTGTESPCPWDDDGDLSKASDLAVATPTEGYICPGADQDWYRFTVPEGMGLLQVDLSVAEFGTINPTYTIWKGDQSETVAAPMADESASYQAALSIVHGIEPGDYAMVITNQGNGEDKRHAYTVTITTSEDKDTHESNDKATDATAVSGAIEGYISYRGDEDWYRVQVPARGLLTVTLEMPAGGILPSYRIEDASGNELIARKNDAGTREDTSLSFTEYLGPAGDYYVVVSDADEQLRSDAEVPYTLSLEVASDPDTNEGNDRPEDATNLTGGTPVSLTTAWTEQTGTGYIASSGDVDWYRVDFDLGASQRGVIEAEARFSGGLPEDMQANVRFMYGVEGEDGKPCTEDQECELLSKPCEDNIDCAMLGTTCDPRTNYCAGAARCIDGRCGAVLTSLTANDNAPGEVTLSAPLLEGMSRMYVVVSDYHDDAYSAGNSYNLAVRTALEPDTHEPSEAYAGIPPTIDDDAYLHLAYRKEVPVHDCTAGDCCSGSTWVEGYLSYTYDQDWYSYAHPCYEEDCMVAVHYELDGGPVDFLLMVGYSTEPWVELTAPSDTGASGAVSNVYGGLNAGDECFFAHNMHESEYNLIIRDTTFVSGGNQDGGTWDGSKDQRYRFCVEKIAAGCQVPPCTKDEYGCFL